MCVQFVCFWDFANSGVVCLHPSFRFQRVGSFWLDKHKIKSSELTLMAHRQSLVPAKTKYDSAVAYNISENNKHYTPEEFSDIK